MIISIIRDIELVSAVGVVESTITYSPCDGTVNFLRGDLRNDGVDIFERTGPDLNIENYDETKESTYQINDIHMHPDGCLKYVSGMSGTTIVKQPEEYSAPPPESISFGSWDHRYAKLGVLSGNVWSKSIDGVTHSLRTAGGKWYYKISKQVTETYWGPEQYDIKNVIYSKKEAWAWTRVVKDSGTEVYHKSNFSSGPIPNGTKFSAGGITYLLGSLRGKDASDMYLYAFRYLLTRTITSGTEVEVKMVSESNLNVPEEKAYCYNSSNCANEWLPKVIIRRGDTLYVRTNTDDVQEIKSTPTPEFTNLDRLDQIPWGWTRTVPTAKYAPLDKKRYTYLRSPSPIEYTVKCDEPFNTIAINGLIASKLEITFLPSDGSDPIPMMPIEVLAERDKDSRLPQYQTTVVGYAPRDIVGSVHIKFINDVDVSVGGIHLGLSVDAGFTNLVFSNSFKDYSPYEKDQFGNIMYIEGVKSNIYTGTVDVKLTDYDMMNRLMASIGGKTIILDGSDNFNNEHIDSVNFFASTALVGRIRNFTLRTKLDNKLMSQMATYSFEIEEDV